MSGLEEKLGLLKASLDDYNIEEEKDVYVFLNVSNILESVYGEADPKIIKKALENSRSVDKLETINDYYFLTFSAVTETKELKKVAYPMFMGALTDYMEESDLDKWSKLVHKIFDAVSSGDMSFENALDYYSGYLDKTSEEDKRFKKWVEYYKAGEHLKYNSIGEEQMKKEAFQFPLGGPGFYQADTKPRNEDDHFAKVKENASKKESYVDWKNKLYAAIRRIDKLLRQSEEHLDSDMQADLADLLHSFDMEVRKVKMMSTASDLAFRTATAFEKKGFKDGHDMLISFAQEAPEQVEAPIDQVDAPGLSEAPDAPEAAPVAPAPEEVGKGSESAIGSALEGGEDKGPGAQPGEYEALAGDVNLGMAASKLEDIAARLADRRTIRQLAEFDIMLDRLGIASMFPELAEAQSKLIDAYSYSLVRVTKMLGMIASGKSLSEVSDAKKSEIVGKTMREVDKAFQGEQEKPQKGTEAIKEEFQGEKAPAAGEDSPQPAPAPPPTEEV